MAVSGDTRHGEWPTRQRSPGGLLQKRAVWEDTGHSPPGVILHLAVDRLLLALGVSAVSPLEMHDVGKPADFERGTGAGF